MVIKDVNINLKDTITCGQIFRYEIEDDDSFTVILSDRVVNIKQIDSDLNVKSNLEDNLEKVIRKYLDLDTDYDAINNELIKKDKNMEEVIKSCSDFKIINSYPLETIISYVISQNNRVPSIKRSLDLICEAKGEKVIFNNKEYYLFPSLEKLSEIKLEEFKDFKVGFRDKYLYNIIKKISSDKDYINSFYTLETDSSLQKLMEESGIGTKVASCILLFAYSKYDVFPVDTWVKKYMKEKYSIEGIKNIEKFSKEKYGKYCGIAIQYMYHSKRNVKLF